MEKIFLLLLLWSWINVSHELCKVQYDKPGSELHFICDSMRLSNMNKFLNEYLKKHGEISNKCNEADRPVLSKPINLILQNILFPINTLNLKSMGKPKLRRDWLVPKVKVKGLTIQYTSLYSILFDAFNSSQFIELEFLEFKRVSIGYLYTKSFNGLKNLKILHMYDLGLIKVMNNFLKPCQNLEVFTMFRCGPNRVILDNFFGKSEYNHLYKVDIRNCNLKSINETTFWGLKSLKILRLNEANISKIEPKSFDVVIRTLTTLNLESNNLTTLPKDIFKSHRVPINFTVILGNNPWHCDCDLNELKSFIKNVNVDKVICETPEDMKGKILNNYQSLCKPSPSPSIIEYPVETVEQSIKPQLEQMITPLNNKFNLQCESMTNTNVTLTMPEWTPLFRVKNTESIVDFIHRSNDFDLLEFEATESNKNPNIKCLSIPEDTEQQNGQVKRTFKPFQLYRFCAIKKTSNTIFPLDCTVFYSNIVECKSWILVDDKTIYIGCYVASMILALFVGISISVAIAMYFRRKNRPLKINITDDMFSSQEELEAVKRLRQAETSEEWHRPANQMSMHDSACGSFSKNEGDSTDADVPPPVPPRNNPIKLDNP